jgi:hypothetical protein
MVSLQFAAGGNGRWQTLAVAPLGDSGRFSFRTAVRESGLLRALAIRTDAASAATAAATWGTSAAKRVTVAADLRLHAHAFDVLGGARRVTVRGSMRPAGGRRRVRLEARRSGAWHVLATARTGPRGGFQLRFRPSASGAASGEALRVAFAGDRLNAPATRGAGRVVFFREALASWYEDGGATACGFHATFGVAHRSLPCGTTVRFRYRGREVTAVVDDRGPFGGGREWDLSQSTAAALGFGGVADVWSST